MSSRVLLVDDDAALLEALPKALKLRMNGIDIDTCESAPAALARLAETDYDAIVTDIKMPGMDGLALLHEIRELRPKTPTLLITGHGEHDLAVQALRGGAYDFVQKPIDRDYFVASLQRAIHLRALDRQVEQQREALERHARVLEHVDDGVFLLDDDGVIQHWNPAAEAITGLKAEDVLGRAADEAIPGWSSVSAHVPISSAPGPGSVRAKIIPLELGAGELWVAISGVSFAEGTVYAFRSLTEERALEELKGEFVATVSHELRTPLAAIYGSAQTLLRSDIDLDDASRKSLLEVIAHESERLTRIAGEILLANNLDSRGLRVEDEEVDLAALVSDVVAELRAGDPDRSDIEFLVSVSDTVEPVIGDGDKLRQVLINLIDNAVKYSPNGGRIEISVDRRESGVRVTVRDEGIGIPHAEQKRIFGKFYRVDPDLARGVGGTGLGLYIARELVRLMDGRISVESREGEGSTFLIDLPVALLTPPIRVGVCSWADETLTKVWYPKGVSSGEERLRYYAERFDTVEANSTYYRLPDAAMVEKWAARTPDGFTMHVKAFGVMTRHPVKLDQLPDDLRNVQTDARGRVDRPPREYRAEVFRRFHDALEPLRSTGKLGGILMQFPSYVVFKPASLEYLEWAKGQLGGDEMLVEFRHGSWLAEENRAATLAFLEEHSMTYVTVDAPRTGGKNVLPTVLATTTGTAYVRFHGRNAETWNKRTGSAAERFDYLYSDNELREWVPQLKELAGRAETVFAMFNNNGRSAVPPRAPREAKENEKDGVVAQAPTNAQMLKRLLGS
jgi:signal transduction histidine kinase/uncharacterized protein YecE (DUF72 family)